MRTINFEDWKKQAPRLLKARIKADNSMESRVPGRRPRDPEKEKVLSRLDKARWKRYIESGKIQIVSPRRWIWRIDIKA